MTTIHAVEKPRIRLEDIRITFPRTDGTELLVLNGVSLDVGIGEFVAVVGPSGCGKSTILRAISGLLTPSSGRVFIDEQEVAGTPDHVGFMFQKDALLPWLTVTGNINVGWNSEACRPASAGSDAGS
nr:ATP-binding cassette domain-containing protein [Aurantimonas aggregata]